MGTSATRAKDKYNLENYDRLYVRVPKGKKNEYQQIAKNAGKSLNQYIIDMFEDKNYNNNSTCLPTQPLS